MIKSISLTQAFATAITLVVFAVSIFLSQTVRAGDFLIGNYDLKGSRAIPLSEEPDFSMKNVKQKGLEIKFFTQTDETVIGVPIVKGNTVFVGTLNFFTGQGSVYSINATTGAINWQNSLTGGVLATPTIAQNALYVAGFGSTLYKLNMNTGVIEDSFSPNFSPISAVDSVWAGLIAITNKNGEDLIIMANNPGDEFFPSPAGISGVVAVKDDPVGGLTEVWRTVINGEVDEDGNLIEGGSGIWELSPSYSENLGLLYVTTGQTTQTLGNSSENSDAVIAIDANTGGIVWKTQVQDEDIWRFEVPFDPTNPKDTDMADGAAVFTLDGKELLGVGSKRGYFYVLDAETGDIVNSDGEDAQGFVKGLDFFRYNGKGAVGNGLDGGYNLDSGYFTHPGHGVVHFGVLSDYRQNLRDVVKRRPPYTDGVCFVGGFGFEPPCPLINTGQLVFVGDAGKNQVGVYSEDENHLYAPVYIDDMIFVRATPNETLGTNVQDPDRILVLDVSNLSKIKLLQEIPLQNGGNNLNSGGGTLSIGNGMLYTGTGFFASQSGLYGIGLKN